MGLLLKPEKVYSAVGIEPSRWLAKAKESGLMSIAG